MNESQGGGLKALKWNTWWSAFKRYHTKEKASLSNTVWQIVSLALPCHSTSTLTWLMASNLPDIQMQRVDMCFYNIARLSVHLRALLLRSTYL